MSKALYQIPDFTFTFTSSFNSIHGVVAACQRAVDFFLRAIACNASCVLAIVEASVCPSVRPSVTLCDCIKTVQAMITKSLLLALRKTLALGSVMPF